LISSLSRSSRFDTNHRYVTSRAERDKIEVKGLLAQRDETRAVVSCAP